MRQPQGRFPSPSTQQLVHLRKNLYVNRHDPMYHEKVIRYLDPHSPEAHYRLAQHFDQKGLQLKALYHYKQTMKVYPSPFYYQASAAIRRLEKNAADQAEAAAAASAATPMQRAERAFPLFLKVLIMTLLFINIALLLIFYAPSAVSRSVTALSPFTVGKSVTYESVEKPFLLHFPYGEPNRKVEDALHQKAVRLAEAFPNAHIVIYGIASSAASADQKAVPLTNEDWKRQAFVIAEYNPAIDQAVKIRFTHPELTAVGANIVRTALNAYIAEHGSAPARLDDLLQAYPNNYMSFLPAEGQSGSASVRTFFNGTGGWVYDREAADPERMFYPNTGTGYEAIPYEPVQLVIEPGKHRLELRNGDASIARYSIGLGADSTPTPNGSFTVRERVVDPEGHSPGVYGAAALSLGSIAIHGTSDLSSIGGNRSLGCIRLSNEEMAKLYPLVPRGAQVVIAQSVPGAAATADGHTAIVGRAEKVQSGSSDTPTTDETAFITGSDAATSESPTQRPAPRLAEALLAAWAQEGARKPVETAKGVLFHWLG